MKIPVHEPWFHGPVEGVFTKAEQGLKLLYMRCAHLIQGGECIYCTLVIEDDVEQPEEAWYE